jgi:hypothetical protein
LLNRYETGPLMTLLFLLGVLVLLVFGLVDALHFHDTYGWFQVLSSSLLFVAFHRHLSRNTE